MPTKGIFREKNVYFTSKSTPRDVLSTGVSFVPSFAFRNRVKQMFYHAYDSYLKYAYPYDELRPLTCDG